MFRMFSKDNIKQGIFGTIKSTSIIVLLFHKSFNNIFQENERKYEMNIREVAIMTKMSELAVRHAIKNGKLASTIVKINETQTRYDISEESVIAWRSSTSVHNQRSDSRNKYTMYLNNDEYKKVVELLKKNKMEEVAELIVRSNPSKAKK